MRLTIDVPEGCVVKVVNEKPERQAPVGSMPLLDEPACRHCGIAIYQPWGGQDQDGLTGWRHKATDGSFYYNCKPGSEAVAQPNSSNAEVSHPRRQEP